MKVLLIDVDKKYPNLALMKLSAYHKMRGDEVGFNVKDPDIVYVSIVFKKNRGKLKEILKKYPDAEIGGAGYDLHKRLPKEVEFLKPDYNLYPDMDYSLGYTTRGCNRNCYFCVVPEMEGRIKIWQHPKEFYEPKFRKIMFLDNNVMFLKDWFRKVMDWCYERRLKVWWTQGFDIRLLDYESAKIIKKVKHYKMINFAWDWIELEDTVKRGLKILRDVGFDLRHNVMFYVYIDSDDEFDSGLYRARKLKEWGTNAFIMFNVDKPRSERIKRLQRWANRKTLFWKMDYDEYDPKRR